MIAESAGLGNITKSSLEHNLSRFRKEVNVFREKNKISYQKKRTSYAPTFYSKMEQTINDIKINKMGAVGVVPYLTGRGVKKHCS